MLNEHYDFSKAPEEAKAAFLQPPDKVRLSAATRLYKFTDHLLEHSSSVSPWWLFVDAVRLPNGTTADGFRADLERATRLKRSHRDYIRARAAVSERFTNTMAFLLVVGLCAQVWAFAGVASGQPEFAQERTDAQNVFLIGGAYQLYIPNLTASHLYRLAAAG